MSNASTDAHRLASRAVSSPTEHPGSNAAANRPAGTRSMIVVVAMLLVRIVREVPRVAVGMCGLEEGAVGGAHRW